MKHKYNSWSVPL